MKKQILDLFPWQLLRREFKIHFYGRICFFIQNSNRKWKTIKKEIGDEKNIKTRLKKELEKR